MFKPMSGLRQSAVVLILVGILAPVGGGVGVFAV
jgi:hypothetical protein